MNCFSLQNTPKRRRSDEIESTPVENEPKRSKSKFDQMDLSIVCFLLAAIDQSQLMKNVVFVLSGFQNPLRADLRTKATKMGATYSDDWDGKCTHLM